MTNATPPCPWKPPFTVLSVSAIDSTILSYRMIDADRVTVADRLSKEQARWLCAALNRPQDGEALLKRCEDLRNALALHAVKQHVRPSYGGEFIDNGLSCSLCQAECETGGLTHAPDCLLAPIAASDLLRRTTSPGWLSEEETVDVEDVRGDITGTNHSRKLDMISANRVERILAIIDRIARLQAGGV